jgi:hypothetical protein
VTIADFTPIIVAVLGGGTVFTFFLQRVLVKRQADNAVVTGATGVVELYRLYAARQDADIVGLKAENTELRSQFVSIAERLGIEERRCNKLEAALRRHGITVD